MQAMMLVPWNIHEYSVESVLRGELIRPLRTFAVGASSPDDARNAALDYARATRGEIAVRGHGARTVHPNGLWGDACWIVAQSPDGL